MPLTSESMRGEGTTPSSPATLGYQAAVAGAPRESPYDGRSRDHKQWLDGYDSFAKPAPALAAEEEVMPPRRRSDDIYVARESGSTLAGGEVHVYVKGVTRVRAGHPLLLAVPDYFEPMDRGVHYDVEDATADPGRLRGE